AARGRREPGGRASTTVGLSVDAEREAARRHARQLLDLVPFWIDHETPDLSDDREEHGLAVAIALRTTTDAASLRIRDAHIAVAEMPRTFERLADGDMPTDWHPRMLRSLRDLTPFQRSQADE